MDNLLAIVLFVFVVGYTVYLIVQRYPGVLDKTSRSHGAPRESSAQDRIYEIANDLENFIENSAHPNDLVTHPDFDEAVGILESFLPLPDVIAYAKGDNIAVAWMAMEALRRRPDSEPAIPDILDCIGSIGGWVWYFAIQFISERATEPVAARVVLNVQEWWTRAPIARDAIRQLLEDRPDDVVDPNLASLLDSSSVEKIDLAIGLLASLKSSTAIRLLEAISGWQESRVDEVYLSNVGMLWDNTSDDMPMEHDGLLEQAGLVLSGFERTPVRSCLLVGEHGVGKSAVARIVGSRLARQGWTVFEAPASAIIAGHKYIGEVEGAVRDLLRRIGLGHRVLWVAPNFHEFLLAGTHQHSPTGVLDLLLPAIERGEIVIIGETTPTGLTRLQEGRPKTRTAFEMVMVPPLSDHRTLKLGAQWFQKHLPGQPDRDTLLREVMSLSRQYLGNQAAPGNLLHLLNGTYRRLAAERERVEHITVDDLIVTVSGMSGLPAAILDDRKELDLESLRSHFAGRVVGQEEAVGCLVDRVAMIKAGLTDPTRPSGVFLFVGPSGTGKTEIAKALAEFLFGSSDRMIRMDMSEFQTSDALARIFGASQDGTGDVQSVALVTSIRQQPFSVVLMDEFEKAHPRVWDVFLQVFDDGRLTDRTGNVADFRHAIIILTSNLGSVAAGKPSIGFIGNSGAFSRAAVEKAVNETFRPEFLNRIDRTVVFQPLSRDVSRRILTKELHEVLQRRGFRSRDWAIEWEPSAIEFLLEKGFSAELGARPLKRAIERYLLTPIARTIVGREYPEGDQFLFVRSDGTEITAEFVDPDAPSEPRTAVLGARREGDGLGLSNMTLQCAGTAQELFFLDQQYAAIHARIESPEWEVEKQSSLEAMTDPNFWDSDTRFSLLGDVEFVDRIETGLETAGSLIHRLKGRDDRERDQYPGRLLRRLAQQLFLLDLALTTRDEGIPRDAFLSVEARPEGSATMDPANTFAARLSEMYIAWSKRRRMRFQIVERQTRPDQPFRNVFTFSGFGAYAILRSEGGLHVFEAPQGEGSFERFKVRVAVAGIPDGKPTEGDAALRRQAGAVLSVDGGETARVTRRYREEPSPLVRDAVRDWRTGKLDVVLGGDFDVMV